MQFRFYNEYENLDIIVFMVNVLCEYYVFIFIVLNGV